MARKTARRVSKSSKAPKTPPGVKAVWKVTLDKWRYQAIATRAPSDKTVYKSNAKSVGVYDTIAEAQAAVENYYKRQKWHPADEKTMIELQKKGRSRTYEDGVGMFLFKNPNSKKGSSVPFRGVSAYHYRSGERVVTKYKAEITVSHVTHRELGFLTPEAAYRQRLELEEQFLPKPRSIPAHNASGEANISIQHKRHVTSYVVSVTHQRKRYYGGSHATMREAMLARNMLLRSLDLMPLEVYGKQ